ncbi:hypothetical protein C480_19949 [Natrialba aegyptia DSM 13077]|uniref:Uncharacterized protein n=1 Tax=Natrialba aegyptia DSM 13077 TaxID=1227491 RepID=M0AM25_9EURY|nr:hypothetical protein C480_19949 [Natrialba aegyptia DSM 13077]
MENRSLNPEYRHGSRIITIGASSRHDDALLLAINVMVSTFLILTEIRVVPRSAFENDVTG